MSVVGWDGGEQGSYSLSMNLKPKKGFRITGFSFSADVGAALASQQIPPHHADHVTYFVPPTVGNGASIHLPGSTEDDVLKSHIIDANGTSRFSFARHDLSIVDAKTFEFLTSVTAYAFDGWYFVPGMEDENEGRLGAYASMSLTNPRLTIYTALLPVPEPATWAMLLAGVGMVGLARRRRRH